MPQRSKIRWGILGCGKVTEAKSGPAFSLVLNSSIEAVMRRNEDQARASAKRLGANKWYSSVESLLHDRDIDAIYLATPPGLHLTQGTACAQAGKPVYVEKPLARNFLESELLVETFHKFNVPLYVAHYRRALPRFIALKDLIEGGEIGTPIEARFRLTRRAADDANHQWLFNKALSGGGKFFDIAPHSIDVLIYLFGPFTEIKSVVRGGLMPHGLEDVAVFSFATKAGVIGTCNYNFLSNQKEDRLEIYGTLGEVSLGIHGDAPIDVSGRAGRRSLEIRNPEFIEEPMIQEVVNSLLGKPSTPCLGTEALEAMRVIDAVLDDYYGGRSNKFWE